METASLYGCWAKIHRADENLQYLDDLIARSAAKKQHGIFADQNPYAGLVTFRVVFPYAKRLWWGVLIGEIVHELRSALDNLVAQLVVAYGNDPTREHQFPICRNPTEYRKKGASRIVGMSPQAQAIIEALQPDDTTDALDTHPLWLLNELSNQDKHRVPALAFLQVSAADVTVNSLTSAAIASMPDPLAAMSYTRLLPFEDKAELFSMAIASHHDVQVNFAIATHISFADAGPATDKPVSKTLHALLDFVAATLDRDFMWLFPEPSPRWKRPPPWE